MKAVTNEHWISLGEMAHRLARDILKSDPPKNLVPNRAAHFELWTQIEAEWNAIIESDNVSLRHNTPKGFTKLELGTASHERTRFSFDDSTVCVHGKPEWTFPVFVNANQLHRYIRERNQYRSDPEIKQANEERCLKHFYETLPGAEPGKKVIIIHNAVREYRVSRNFALRAWKQVTTELGLADLTSRGRPTKVVKNQIAE